MNLDEKRMRQSTFVVNFDKYVKEENLSKLQELIEKELITEEQTVDFCFVNNEIAIQFLGYQAGVMELRAGYNQFFGTYHGIREWIDTYYKVKFAMRRLACYNTKKIRQECIAKLDEANVSIEVEKVIASASIQKKERLFCRLAYAYYEAEKLDFVLSYLVAALDWDDNEENTLYTLCFLLIQLNQEKLAKQYFDSFTHWSDFPQIIALRERLLKGNEVEMPQYQELPLSKEKEKKEYSAISSCTFSFIQCVNQEYFYQESLWYINQLKVPKGCKVETIAIRDAKGICEGYNRGMKQATGEIKIYLHQDIMLIYPYILYELLDIYEKETNLGLLGLCGSKDIPPNGVWFESREQVGECFVDNILIYRHAVAKKTDYPYESVALMDGIFLATFCDIPWRETLFDRWHFYDASQCMEMRRAGYETALIYEADHWCVHDGDIGEFEDESYKVYQDIFQKEYKDEIAMTRRI